VKLVTKKKRGKKIHSYTFYLKGFSKPFHLKASNPDDALKKLAKKLKMLEHHVWDLYIRGYEDGKYL
jgi:hypothetical protein